jgi:hypothetical protein
MKVNGFETCSMERGVRSGLSRAQYLQAISLKDFETDMESGYMRVSDMKETGSTI